MSIEFEPNEIPYVERVHDGTFLFHIPPILKEILNEHADHLKSELSTETDLHPNLMRLNPPASLNDIQRAIDFSSLYNFSIRNTHLSNLQALTEFETDVAITAETLNSIAMAINSLRLFLGSELGIDGGEAENSLLMQSGSYHLYILLGYLLGEIVTALSEQN